MLEQRYQNLAIAKAIVECKIANVTGLPRKVSRKLASLENYGNVIKIANYILTMKTEESESNRIYEYK